MIPEAAFEVAVRALIGAVKEAPLSHVYIGDPTDALLDGNFDLVLLARKALEAAAPHMRQAFFLEMNLRAVQDELNTPLQFGRPTP